MNKKNTFDKLDDLLAACHEDNEAQRFLILGMAFLQEGWTIHDFEGDRFCATRPATEPGVESHEVFVDVDADHDCISWTASRNLTNGRYEFYDSVANEGEILTAIESETGFPCVDLYPNDYTLYEED
jgi:hypothetical protein